MSTPYITFKLENKFYATRAINVVEIIKFKKPEVFEKMPQDILGVIPFRGKIINILNIKKKLGANEDYKNTDQILILNINENFIGIFVDEVKDILPVEKKEIEPLPYQTDEGLSIGLLKIEDELFSIIDFKNIFDEQHIKHTETSIAPAQNTVLEQKSYSLTKKEDNYVSFKLDENIYCINFTYIKEFSEFNRNNITKVPHTPDYFKGIVNLRGEFVNIFDIREFLNIKPKNLKEKVKTVIISDKDVKIGIIADEIYDIMTLPEDKNSINHHLKSEKNNFSKKEIVVGDNKVITILNIEKLLKEDKIFIDIN